MADAKWQPRNPADRPKGADWRAIDNTVRKIKEAKKKKRKEK